VVAEPARARALGHLQMARALLQQAQHPEAEIEVRRALECDPDSAAPWAADFTAVARAAEMAGVPPAPSSGVDMSLMATILQLASKEPAMQSPTGDDSWKGTLEGNIDVKIYAPLSSKTLRQTCGVSWDILTESFLDTAHNAVHVAARRLGTVKKRGIFSREEDQILLAPSGPYVAKTISAQECKYLARIASRYCEHFQDCQNSLLPRFYCIVRIGKGRRVKTTEHWVVTDNLNDLPLPVQLTYDLKGVSSRNTVVASGNEPLVVLKEGNLPLRLNERRLPQVRTLPRISKDCALFIRLSETASTAMATCCLAR
jgi:hypothetical protein